MNTLKSVLFFILVSAFSCANVKLNTLQQREQIQADSLRIADSIRVADSVRTADSLLQARYEMGDMQLQEREKGEISIIESRIQVDMDTVTDTYASDNNALASREIVIEQDNPYAREIDSLQAKIDSLDDLIYARDKKYASMKEYSLVDKKAYIRFLLKNHMKDTAQVLSCCERLYEILNLEHQKLVYILKTQKGNTRGLVNLHIKKVRAEMGDIGCFMLSFRPEVPGKVKYEKNKERFD